MQDDDFAQVFGGNALYAGMQPWAANYGGHQFGHWAGQLGDGRAISLGELVAPDGRHWELQLKGAGPTPYSRGADGRAVLRSSIREFLCSEAMHHLGVPTTRALSLVGTGEDVVRDMFYDGHPRAEPGAIVCRVAPSFLRFGSFELPASRGEQALLQHTVLLALGKAIDHGTTSWQNLVNAYTAGGTLSITGTNASAANTSPTISMVGVQARAGGDLTVSATTNNAATDAIFINSSAYFSGVPAPGYIGGASSFVSTGGNTTLKSNQGSILIQDGVPNSVTSTAITGKNVIIDNTGGTFAGGVFTAGSGVSTAAGRSGVQIADSVRVNDPNLASNPMLRTITATDGGQIVLSGKKASTLGSGVEIRSSAALTAANITINGENTGASGAAINISNGAARLTSTQATTLTSGGVGSGTSLVAAGNISVGTQLTVTNPAVGSISGTISGTGSLLKSGAGQLTLSAYNAITGNYETNTFSGGTTISQGALVIGHGGGNYNKTAGTGAIVVGDLNTGNNNVSLLVEKGTPGNEWGYLTRDITFTNNGTGTATLGTTYGPAGETGRGWSTVNSKITLNRDVVMNDATNDRLTLDGQITGTGNITLTGSRITMGAVSGTGISANDFVGNVTISSGTGWRGGSS